LGRNNSSRLGNKKPDQAEAPPVSLLDFVAPTEIVDIPSKGKYYAKGHPMHGRDSLEIRFMTAKDEDILTNRSLITKGIVLDRFLQSIIIDDSIDVGDLLIGDKNALLIAARATAYGAGYDASLKCRECSVTNEMVFDLTKPTFIASRLTDTLNITENDDGTFSTTLPMCKFNVKFGLLTNKDETYLAKYILDNIESESLSATLEQLKIVTLQIQDVDDQEIIHKVLENIVAADARHLKLCLEAATPNIEIKQTMKCKSCDHTEEVEVPFGIDFFWPKR
tara:strand:- start:9568 stop:10404 length:837 start_codon:yes stop_codon:yes gene_type:complete